MEPALELSSQRRLLPVELEGVVADLEAIAVDERGLGKRIAIERTAKSADVLDGETVFRGVMRTCSPEMLRSAASRSTRAGPGGCSCDSAAQDEGAGLGQRR